MITKITGKMLQEATLTHQANIQRSLEHRLQVARTKGNQELVHLLEAEFNQLGTQNVSKF